MLFNYDNQVVLPLLSFHVTPQGEMKMPVCIEDECNSELPPASLLFRTARQYAYGVLFSLAETQRRLERLALRKRAPLEGGSLEGGERFKSNTSYNIYSFCHQKVKDLVFYPFL